nr:hypothetical protein [Tanacetum cinerariifolium]
MPEGFNQIINFLNGISIKYALTVNLNIYVSCIKQFWTIVTVKQMNDVTRLQALVDNKKVVVTKATIQEALRLDDEEGVEYLPNEEIFAELARMGYEKPSTKLTFYKAFFSSQKFNFSKYIFDNLVRNVDSPTKFYMYPRFLQLIIQKQVGDLSTHTTKYTSPALTQKVFSNIRRVGDTAGNDENVHARDAAEGDVSAAYGEVLTVAEEQFIPSPTPPTQTPQPPQDIPSTSQHLEFDKVAQDLEIKKLKKRVQKLERINKVRVLKVRMLQRVRSSQRVETSDETMMDDVSNQGRMIAEVDADADVVLKDVKEAADEAKEVAKDTKDETELAKVQEVLDVVTTAKLITEVVTAASETITATSTNITAVEVQVPAATLTTAPARDKGKEILVEEPKPLKKKQQIKLDEQYARELHAELNKDIDWDEVIDHVKIKAKEDPTVKKYQAMKRKPQTEAQARKNMMLYLKNVAGFKMNYFKGMSYDDIRLIFEAKFNSNVAFLLKTKEQIEDDENRALQRLNETLAEKADKMRKLDKEKNQRSVHGPAKVKGWKLLESCGVQIITFTTSQLILLVERKYPLTRFTLDQMLNAVRLEVKEGSEVSLELLRFTRQQHQEGQLKLRLLMRSAVVGTRLKK